MVDPTRGADGLTLHERIAMLRRRLKLKQEDVAAAVLGDAGKRSTVSGWENSTVPGGENLIALRELLEVDGHYLMTGVGPPRHEERGEAVRKLALLRRFADPRLNLTDELYHRLLAVAEDLQAAATPDDGS